VYWSTDKGVAAESAYLHLAWSPAWSGRTEHLVFLAFTKHFTWHSLHLAYACFWACYTLWPYATCSQFITRTWSWWIGGGCDVWVALQWPWRGSPIAGRCAWDSLQRWTAWCHAGVLFIMMNHQLDRNTWLVTCFTRPAQVQLNSTPSSFLLTSVICPTQFFAFPFALSVHMHCSYIPVGLIFRLELSMLGFSRFILVWKSRDSCMFLCWMHASQLDELQRFVCS